MIERVRLVAIGGVFLLLCGAVADQADGYVPLARTVTFQGVERSYCVVLPSDFNPDAVYWPLVVVHGGGGNARTNPKAMALRRIADTKSLPAILVLPEFVTDDKQVSRFPLLGEGCFLEELLKEVRAEFKLHAKILLSGYSMGGQFAHRYAFANPNLVQACAALAAGTWTTRKGSLLIEQYGEVKEPSAFLSSEDNAEEIPDRLRDLFDPRIVEVACLPAAPGAEKVPFLVMCGALDTRLSIAREFASCLRETGFSVETEWPNTPHTSGSEAYAAEFEKYAEHTVAFFKKHTDNLE